MHLLGCVLLLLHPGTLGDDELMAALVDDTRAHWKHSINTRRSQNYNQSAECDVVINVITSLDRTGRSLVFCSDADALLLH